MMKKWMSKTTAAQSQAVKKRVMIEKSSDSEGIIDESRHIRHITEQTKVLGSCLPGEMSLER